MGARVVERGERGVDRLHHRLDQGRRLGGAAFQPPHRGRKRRHRRLRTGNGVERRAQILGGFFRLHHRGTPFGERGFLAALRRELPKLIDGVAQPLRLAAGAFDVSAMRRHSSLACAALFPQ